MATTDTRTDAERRYDAERDGTLYTAQPIADEPLSPDEETILTILLAETKHREAFGQLAGGTLIYGLFEGGQRSPCANITTSEWCLTADNDGHFAGGTRDQRITFEDWSLSDIAALRNLLNSDAIERLHAAAVAWAAGDTQPPGDLFDAGFQAGYAAGLEDGRIEAKRAA